MLLKLGHSPDPDDAFLTYPITHKKIPYPQNIEIREIVLDIETLNKLAIVERLDVSAVSVGAYLLISDKYLLIPYGASIGYDYGPKLLIRRIERDVVVAVPGTYTTARILTELYLREEYSIENIKIIDVPFEKILELITNDLVDCGVLIHEEQLREFKNLTNIDLGAWWRKRTGLPIPLGVDVVHDRVGIDIAKEISNMFRKAIEYSYKNINEVLEYAMKFSRLKDRELVLKFIKMYVKDIELTYESPEIKAIQVLHDLCKKYDIQPFSRSRLNIRIIR
ncbi:MAG: ABC transporter substrate-binding protein [Crenarchaeota archaeon]|nr:ABC transporter substrate-binding protein [Thermoproteota archaeon]